MSNLVATVRRAWDGPEPFWRDLLSSRPILEGVPYVRHKTWNVIETAWVSDVVQDKSGVSHIRFDVTLRHRDRTFADGPRTMGLESFVRLYHPQH